MLLILPEKVTLPEGTVYLNSQDPIISSAIALGQYEIFETKLLRSILQPGMTVVDIGANLGYYVVIASGRVGPTGKVLAFEPEPRNFELLSKNASALTNVELHQVAASNQEGEIRLGLSPINMGAHTMVPMDILETGVAVKTVVVDSIVKDADMVMMDIEGAEPLALAGMKKLLAKTPILFIELNLPLLKTGGNDPMDILKLLHGYGYQIYNIDAHGEKLHKVSGSDFDSFLKSLNGKLTNLYCVKHLTGREIGL